jgi:hypothetical protein
VSRTLLGVNRETTQQGLFGNVSTYGLDPKDWRIDSEEGYSDTKDRYWWTRRPSATGNYYPVSFDEDERNSAIVLSANPTPFLEPSRPRLQDQLINPGGAERYTSWGQYINSVVALYLIRYAVDTLPQSRWAEYNLLPTLSKYPPIDNGDGTFSFNELYWDKLWLDIQQNKFGNAQTNYPILPSGKAYNFNGSSIPSWRSNAALWGSSSVFITEADDVGLPTDLETSWDSFFFSTTRVYYPNGRPEDRGHYRIKTNPTPEIWEKYFGLRWSELRSDLKNWEFTVHTNESTVTDLEKDLKLPYFILNTPVTPDPVNNTFSNFWPAQSTVNLPTNSNRIGGTQGVTSEITLKSIRSFRYQPGRISGFTYGVKVSDIGAGPGTILEFGIENDTDSYMFRLSNGALFSVVRRSTVPLENTNFLQEAKYSGNTRTVFRNGQVQYETVIEQKIMNGDPLSGEGETGYFLDPSTVTMYKIEFGWYGAIGARFYAYVPVENNECRWVTLHTLVIENQLGKPCLADPFFYFKYRLKISDSSAIRIDQYVHKFGASYYIDGYDEGTLYTLNAQSRVRYLPSPGFSEFKTYLNAIDWTTLMGIKPRQFVVNRFGTELYNKKEIFPENFFVYSQQDCEIRVVRQKGCPEWAYSHQEGYQWNALPESRRLKGKFKVSPYWEVDLPDLNISADDAGTHTAVLAYSTASSGNFRNPTVSENWDVAGSQTIRLLGDDLYALAPNTPKDFKTPGTVRLKLYRDGERNNYLSSRKPVAEQKDSVYLPFTYAQVSPYEQGYDIEFDYFRRDQVLLSSVDVLSDEFYIYWVGGSLESVVSNQVSSLRVGFVWPSPSNKTVLEYGDFSLFPDPGNTANLYLDQDTNKYYEWNGTEYVHTLYANNPDPEWGVETNASYDELTFSDGLPFDFAFDHPDNTLYVETNPTLVVNTYNLESEEFPNYEFTGVDNLSVPGTEGGPCRGLFCKTSRELRNNVNIISVVEEGVPEYYISDLETSWPNLGTKSYNVTVVQGGTTANIQTSGGQVLTIGEATQYVLPIGQSLPDGISEGKVDVYYNIVYIASIDKRSKVRYILVSSIAPGNIPFIRVFVQGRQGARLGGLWVGQKTANGIRVEPFTPHRSTVSLSDDGSTESHSGSGPLKVIQTYTHIDSEGGSTAPTLSLDPLDTYKSVHTSPKKCGSFLSAGGINAAGIFTPSDYPIRWLTSNEGTPLATYYVSANTPTQIDLNTVFNVSGESIVNEDDGNLATFFIARSLGNINPSDPNEIYMSLNYSEQ